MAAHGLRFSEFEVLTTLRGGPPLHELAPTEVELLAALLEKQLAAVENS